MALACFGAEASDMTNTAESQKDSLKIGCRGIFERPATSFAIDPRLTEWILADPANPLNRITQSIPDGATVLDVGAGNGILARLLFAAGRRVVIDAIEPDSAARAFSDGFYREMFDCNLEAFLVTAADRSERYDFIVMADVVEHLQNPEPYLYRLKTQLKRSGVIALSTPNIAFLSVRLALLLGRFDYVDSGILERTHLRFYTRKTLQHLFSAAKLFPIAEYHCLRDPFLTEIALANEPLPLMLLNKLVGDELASVYQFLFLLSAMPSPEPAHIKLGSAGRAFPINYLLRRGRSFLLSLRQSIQSMISSK